MLRINRIFIFALLTIVLLGALVLWMPTPAVAQMTEADRILSDPTMTGDQAMMHCLLHGLPLPVAPTVQAVTPTAMERLAVDRILSDPTMTSDQAMMHCLLHGLPLPL